MFIQSIKYDKEHDRGTTIHLVITIRKPSGEDEDHKFKYRPMYGQLSKLFYISNVKSPHGHYPSKFVANFRDSENAPNIIKKAIEFLKAQKSAGAAK
tara:strand:+ start:565 stop:855 length:291 start_codon:yes stop_codon:yes gene_type:complete